jgi:hypothetical protein
MVLDGLEDGQYSLTLTAAEGQDQVADKTISFRIGQINRVYLPALSRQ